MKTKKLMKRNSKKKLRNPPLIHLPKLVKKQVTLDILIEKIHTCHEEKKYQAGIGKS